MEPLRPGDLVMNIAVFAGEPATVVRQMPPDSPDVRGYWNVPVYEIEWSDGRREVVGRNWLTREFSFGVAAAEDGEHD